MVEDGDAERLLIEQKSLFKVVSANNPNSCFRKLYCCPLFDKINSFPLCSWKGVCIMHYIFKGFRLKVNYKVRLQLLPSFE